MGVGSGGVGSGGGGFRWGWVNSGGGGVDKSSTESFCSLSLGFKWIRPGRTLALQSFRVTQLISAEILAKFCTTQETKIKWQKFHFNVIFYLL